MQALPFQPLRNKELRSVNDAFNIMQTEEEEKQVKKKKHFGHAVYCSLVF